MVTSNSPPEGVSPECREAAGYINIYINISQGTQGSGSSFTLEAHNTLQLKNAQVRASAVVSHWLLKTTRDF